MVEWRLNRGVTKQTESFLKGLFEVVDPSWLQLFDEREIEVSFVCHLKEHYGGRPAIFLLSHPHRLSHFCALIISLQYVQLTGDIWRK